MRHRLAWLGGLTLVVAAVHLLLTRELALQMGTSGEDAPTIKRMEATYVRELQLTAPPRAAAAPAAVQAAKPTGRPRKIRKAPKPVRSASAPEEVASAAEPAQAASEVSVAEAPASAASAPVVASSASASAPVQAAAASAAGPAFEWPAATRVDYTLEGYFRGPIYGQASVEWIRQGNRYQVHVDASVGPSFAPVGSWRLTSEGEIRADGLYPQRYQHVNRLLIKSNAPRSIQLNDDEVVLEKDKRVPRAKGVQDPASHFAQLAYDFSLNPALLTPGRTIEIPLVNLKKAETLAYDVIKAETLSTPIGQIPTMHLKPRRTVVGDANGALPADIWVAPGLQYLPVRILVRMDEQTYMDMRMKRAPRQAAAPAAVASTPRP